MPRTLLRKELAVEKSVHKELTIVSGVLTQVDAWTTVAKDVKLFTATYTYDGNGRLTSVQTTHDYSGEQTTKSLTYDVDGNLTDVTTTHG